MQLGPGPNCTGGLEHPAWVAPQQVPEAGRARFREIPALHAALRRTGDSARPIAGQSLQVDAHPPSRSAFLRFAALALVCAACFAVPAAAQAGDLIQLNGDPPVTLQGNNSYGLLYLDGVVRLSGDTGITATDVFIGPDAVLQTCFDSATNGANNCINGRSLGISASGGVAISPAIDLRGGVGPNRGGGTLIIRAARVSLGGTVETAGVASQSGRIVIDSPGLVVTQTLHAPGADIIVRGGGGVVVGGDVWSAGDTSAGTEPGRDTNGGGIESELERGRPQRPRCDRELGTRCRSGNALRRTGWQRHADRRRDSRLRRHRLAARTGRGQPRGSARAHRRGGSRLARDRGSGRRVR